MRSRGYCKDRKYPLLRSFSLLIFFYSFLIFLTFFLICFAAVEQPELEERYQGRIEAALGFALTLSSEDFKSLVGTRRLYECCLKPEPSKLVLEKIALEERSALSLSLSLSLFLNDEQFSLY